MNHVRETAEHGKGGGPDALTAAGAASETTRPYRIIPDGLERDDFSSNRHPALAYCWSMIFSENRFPLLGIMLKAVCCRAGRHPGSVADADTAQTWPFKDREPRHLRPAGAIILA